MTNQFRTGLLLSAILIIFNACTSNRNAFYAEEIRKQGIVFRLQDYKNRIDFLEKQGMSDRAREEKAKIEEDNRNLVQHFQTEFNFCPVRFYYASQNTELLQGKPVLLNSNMEPDASIPLPDSVLLASFSEGKVEDNTFEWKAFRVAGTTIHIRPTYKTWWRDRPVQAEDVRRVNRVLFKMNGR